MSYKPIVQKVRFLKSFAPAGVIALFLCISESLLAEPRTWSGGAADSLWNSPANWNGAIGSGDSLTFSGSTRLANSNNLSAGTSFAGITFSSGAGDFVLSGNAIGLSSDIVNSDNAGNQTINLNVAFSKNSQINSVTGATTVIGGSVSGSVNLTINKGIDDRGLVVLGGANSYSGTTTIGNGVLRIGNGTALGTVGSGTTVSNGAALELQGDIAVGGEALSIVGSGVNVGGAMRNVSGNNSYGGLLTLGGATRIHSDSGTLNLDVASGNAITGTAAALIFGGSGNIIVSDAICNTSGTLSKEGAGVLTLAAANNYSGTTSVNAGALVVNGCLGGGNVDVANGASLSGNASIGGVLNVSGVLIPGSCVGTLSVSQCLVQGATSIVRFDLNAANQGIGLGINDLIVVGGNLTLDGTLDVLPWDVGVNGNFSTRNSGSWTLFRYTGSLTDHGLTLGQMPTLAAGYEWRLNTCTANAVTLNIVPEPSTALLSGLASILLFRRRR
jgi:autotransporter-associated beta strand protein